MKALFFVLALFALPTFADSVDETMDTKDGVNYWCRITGNTCPEDYAPKVPEADQVACMIRFCSCYGAPGCKEDYSPEPSEIDEPIPGIKPEQSSA